MTPRPSASRPDLPDVVVILTDQERAPTPYESPELTLWRRDALAGARWFDEHGVSFRRHYTGSLACVPSRPTLLTGQYPDVHGVTQTDGFGKLPDDTAMRWLRPGEVPTLGHWFRAAGYDTHYDGKWHLTHADIVDPVTHAPLATNDDDGIVDHDAVARYLAEDRLDEFGFSGWVGPEPHGAPLANSGLRRDPLIADRVVAWLTARYARRRAGDPDARRPFLLVVSFVNPHDIVLFPGWLRNDPLGADRFATPDIAPAPTADEDLSTKPAAQAAYRDSYPTGYAPIADGVYDAHAAAYRRLYHRLHAEVDGPLDRVRRAVTDGGSDDVVIVRSADHGELLGAHGGLHQKWFNLYDEAARVPFVVVRTGASSPAPTTRGAVDTPSSHVDLVPTLLDLAGIDAGEVTAILASSFSEVHPLPGRSLAPDLTGATTEPGDRTVYLMTRDNVLEGDTGVSTVARVLGLADDPPPSMWIEVAADVGTNFEAIVTTVDGRIWKLARCFDDPGTWTEPGVRQLASSGVAGPTYRTEPLADEWELYDLTGDPIEATNRWTDPALASLRDLLRARLDGERDRCVPQRNTPWPYASRRPRTRV